MTRCIVCIFLLNTNCPYAFRSTLAASTLNVVVLRLNEKKKNTRWDVSINYSFVYAVLVTLDTLQDFRNTSVCFAEG